MSGFKIAEAYVDITARNLMADAIAGAIKQIRGVGAEADAVGAKSTATGLLGSKAFLMIGAGAAGGAVAVVKMAADFQSSTNRLVTSAGESRNNIGMIRDGILAMAGSVGYSADQLSTAMYKVESGGQRGADGLKVLQAAAEGAKTENADLTVVADALTSAMVDYKIPADQAATTTSKLVAATSQGKMTFQELAGSMAAILPVASANHVSLNDILGDLAAMTVHGMSAEQASQNLADAIRHMAAPTQMQSKELAILGLNATEVSKSLGEKGLSGTVNMISDRIRSQMGPDGMVVLDLTNALKGMAPPVQDLGRKVLDGSLSMKDFSKEAKAMGVINDKNVVSFATLAGATHGIGTETKSGAQIYQTYSGALRQAMGDATGMNVALMIGGENAGITANAIKVISGATAEAGNHVKGWADIQSTFNQKISAAKDGLGALAISIGEKLLPVASKIAGTFADATRWVSEHKVVAEAVAYTLGVVVVAALGALTIATVKWVAASVAGFAADMAKGAVWAAVKLAQFAMVAVGAGDMAAQISASSVASNMAASASGKLSGALSKMGNALPVVGAALIGLDLLWQHYITTQDDGARALIQGGAAAEQMKAKVDDQLTGFGKWLNGMVHMVATTDDMTAAMHQQLNAMDPLTRAQTLATQAQNDYLNAVEKYGATSTEAMDAQGRYNAQTSEATRLQGILKDGLDSTTDAVKRQQDAILGAANADIGYEDALQRTKDALARNGQQINIHTQAGRDNRQAFLDLIRATRDDETAMQDNGVGIDVLNTKHQQHITQLADVAKQMGFTDDEANTYIGTLGRVPTSITTRFFAATPPAIAQVADMAMKISDSLRSIQDEQVSIHFNSDASMALARARATGGPIFGPGSETSDSIPALLSNNEHVWSAAEVRGAGGHSGVAQLRSMAAAGRLSGFASGGPVLWDSTESFRTLGISDVINANLAAVKSLVASMFSSIGGNLGAWIQQALAITGTPGSWAGPLSVLIGRESGGNPNAINLTDSNAAAGHPSQGLMQTIPGTFNAYHQPGTSWSITDPVANIAAGINYIKSRYGSIFNVQQANPNLPPRGYDAGGLLPTGLSLVRNSTGQPERVLNATQTAKLDRLLAGRGGGQSVTVNVTQVSGSPAETGRFVALALRTVS